MSAVMGVWGNVPLTGMAPGTLTSRAVKDRVVLTTSVTRGQVSKQFKELNTRICL